jgi:hypothetical protein
MGWLTFVIALVVYILTLEQSVSLWDCGEFISASYRLQIVHPPGAPLFLMLGRIFTIFATEGTNEVAIAVNMLSAVASAATVMFTFWITTHFAKKIAGISLSEKSIDLGNAIAILGSGLVAALSVTFMDTFWFSAVEAEVYAASSCFMALAFWAILKWENVKDEPRSERWIVFVAYVVGLGIGLHLLNLLVVPAIVLYYFIVKYKPTTRNVVIAAVIGLGSIALLQWVVIPKTPVVAANFDKLFVNGFGLPFNSGVLFYMLWLGLTVAVAILYTHSKKKLYGYLALAGFAVIMLMSGFDTAGKIFSKLVFGAAAAYGFYYVSQKRAQITNLVLICFAFIMLGFSSYSMVVIRSLADPAIDMNDPQDAYSLLSYINREQYGDRPLLYGPYWIAKETRPTGEEGDMQYRRGESEYVEIDNKIEYVWDERYCTILPRMGDMTEKAQYYPIWCGMDNVFINIKNLENQVQQAPNNQELRDRLAKAKLTIPSFKNNMKFMFNYQIGWMYWRYFMWNFVGRQNDLQNVIGNKTQGNWVSGIPFIDKMNGIQPDVPKHLKSKAHNKYYFLPFILGLLGLIIQLTRSKNDFWTVLVMFIFTGVLIVIYLNQPPMEPRERDYTNVGSYQTFCIWIGLSVMFFVSMINKGKKNAGVSILATVVALFAAPFLMGSQNWDDHDRSDRYLGISFAKNYLNSCEQNAILFTNGDNDTYPLWYAQNVEGVRTDVRVINLSLLPTEWYSGALRRKVFDSEPLPMEIPADKLVTGKREYTRFNTQGKNQGLYYPLGEVLDFATSDNPKNRATLNTGKSVNYIPVKKLVVEVDKDAVINSGIVPEKDHNRIVSEMKWDLGGRGGLSKGDLVVLDIIRTNAKTGWKRPIYWTTTTGNSVYLNLDKYLRHNGLTFQLIPVERNPGSGGMDDMDLLYDKLMNVYEWGNMEKGEMFLDDKAQLVPQNLRNLFINMARYHVSTGKADTAVALLDKCYASVPESILPMPLKNKVITADVYLQAGKTEIGDKLLIECGDDALELYKFYSKFKGQGQLQSVVPDMNENLNVIKSVYQYAQKHNRTEIATKYEGYYNQYNKAK